MKNRKSDISRKILVSILFGLFAVVFNNFNVFLISSIDSRAIFVLGNFFILTITLCWGWKYGLLSYLPWFAVMHINKLYGNGFLLILQFVMMLIWLVLHGEFAAVRKSRKKWYFSVYVVELGYIIFMIAVMLLVFSVNSGIWEGVSSLTDFVKYYLVGMVTRNIRYQIFAGIIIRLNFFRMMLGLEKKSGISNLLIYLAISAGIIIWMIHIGTNVFYNGYQLSVESIEMLYSDPQVIFLMKVIMYLLFVIGVVFSDFFETIIAGKRKSEAENRSLKSILKLAVLADDADNITENIFMENLLDVFMNVIPQTHFGTVFSVEDEYMEPVIDKGVNDRDISNLRLYFNENYKLYNGRDIFVINDKSKLPFNLFEKGIAVAKESLDFKEAMFIILKVKGLPVAAVALKIKEDSNAVFDGEAIRMAALLKNIPLSYYHKIKGFENREVIYRDMITSIIQIQNIYDPYTNEHSEHVADLSVNIAHKLGFNDEDINEIYWAALVHDIGKVVIPIDIIGKQGELTDEEYDVVKNHPVWGYEALAASSSLKNIAKVVRHHHERWDGKGYPDALSESEIPYYSRIIAVADSFDAMTTDRPYRRALTKQEAILEIIKCSGKQFDPEIVDAFYLIRDKF